MVRSHYQFGKQLLNSAEIIIYGAKCKIQKLGRKASESTARYFDVLGKEKSIFILCIEQVPSNLLFKHLTFTVGMWVPLSDYKSQEGTQQKKGWLLIALLLTVTIPWGRVSIGTPESTTVWCIKKKKNLCRNHLNVLSVEEWLKIIIIFLHFTCGKLYCLNLMAPVYV